MTNLCINSPSFWFFGKTKDASLNHLGPISLKQVVSWVYHPHPTVEDHPNPPDHHYGHHRHLHHHPKGNVHPLGWGPFPLRFLLWFWLSHFICFLGATTFVGWWLLSRGPIARWQIKRNRSWWCRRTTWIQNMIVEFKRFLTDNMFEDKTCSWISKGFSLTTCLKTCSWISKGFSVTTFLKTQFHNL